MGVLIAVDCTGEDIWLFISPVSSRAEVDVISYVALALLP